MNQKLVIFLFATLSLNAQVKLLFEKINPLHHKSEKSVIEPSKSVILENGHLFPFYGEANRSPEQILTDEEFIKTCKKNFKNREEASKFFAARGWEYLGEAQIDTAIYRFNLAWLLDKENVDSYWGQGVIAYQKGNIGDAVRFLEKGIILDPSNVTIMVDLATVKIKQFLSSGSVEDLSKAQTLLEKSTKIAPDFAEAYQKWSLTAFHKGEFDKAWAHFHKSYELEPASIDTNFLTNLLDKALDPKGLFKK